MASRNIVETSNLILGLSSVCHAELAIEKMFETGAHSDELKLVYKSTV
jgi:hypothetical protein